MSAASNCDCPCPTIAVTLVPGSPGDIGPAGVNAFTITTSDTTIPAINATVVVDVENSTWAVVDQIQFISDGVSHAFWQVVTIPSSTELNLRFLGYVDDSPVGNVIATGAGVSPAGVQPPLAGPVPAAITDNTGEAPTNAIEATVGIHTLVFYMTAANIANGDLLTGYTPGYAFEILSFDARCAVPVTTGAKAATLNLEIDATNLTGGVISLAGTYTQGQSQNGSTVTGTSVGTSTQTISIEASAVTAFVEGAFWLILRIKNKDTANALSTLTERVNDLITALS